MDNKNFEEELDKIIDDEFIEKMFKANSNEDVKKIFKEKNLDLTDEQINQIKKKFLQLLSDSDLCKASGGISYIANGALRGAGYGALHGSWIGATVGAVAGLGDQIMHVVKEDGKVKSFWQATKNVLKTSVAGALLGTGMGAGVTGIGFAGGDLGDKGIDAFNEEKYY